MKGIRKVESGSLNQIFYGYAHSGRNRSHSVNNKCFIISTFDGVCTKEKQHKNRIQRGVPYLLVGR